QNNPQWETFAWLDRPVKMDELELAVKAAIASEGKKTILVVDDDPSYAKMVREWLREVYHVCTVTGGMNAIKFLLATPVDIILLDYEMPVVDGPQVLQMLRQEPATKEIPVIFLTGVDTREGVERVMALKPDGYILKSTTKEKLLEYLRGKIG
ncbi:MAG: response regulator, partial [Schwartzia sp.]|nr:response regulator [Schwartzia sp. (in: firmicutes)]